MRKFRLIKPYPGSPELGAIRKDLDDPILSKYFTTYPEFWQEVIEPDFEILSFKQDSGIKDLWTKFLDGWSRNVNGYPATSPYTLEDMLKNDLYKIHSVKRLSDGEIFTIGDRAKTITSKGKHIVTQLSIRQKCTGRDGKGGYNYDGVDRIWIDWEDDCGGNWLESTEKVKHPLFLTHDGENIYEGDEVWFVNKENFYYDYILTLPQTKFCSDTRAYFLTREQAEEYIIEKYILLKQVVKQRLNLK